MSGSRMAPVRTQSKVTSNSMLERPILPTTSMARLAYSDPSTAMSTFNMMQLLFSSSIWQLQGLVDTHYQFRSRVVSQVARHAAFQYLVSCMVQVGFEFAQHGGGGNQHQGMALLSGHCIVEVRGQMQGKAAAVFGVNLGVRLKLRPGMAGSAMALACLSSQITATGLAGQAGFWKHKTGQFGQRMIHIIALKTAGPVRIRYQNPGLFHHDPLEVILLKHGVAARWIQRARISA